MQEFISYNLLTTTFIYKYLRNSKNFEQYNFSSSGISSDSPVTLGLLLLNICLVLQNAKY